MSAQQLSLADKIGNLAFKLEQIEKLWKKAEEYSKELEQKVEHLNKRLQEEVEKSVDLWEVVRDIEAREDQHTKAFCHLYERVNHIEDFLVGDELSEVFEDGLEGSPSAAEEVHACDDAERSSTSWVCED